MTTKKATKPPAKKPAAKPVSQDEKDEIVRLCRANVTRNDIVRETGRSAYIVSKVVKDAGLSFDQTKTAAANQAKQVLLEAERLNLEEAVIEVFRDALARTKAPHVEYTYDKERGEYIPNHLPAPTARDFSAYAKSLASLASAVKTMRDATKGTSDDGKGDIDALQSFHRNQIDGNAANLLTPDVTDEDEA